MEPVGDVFPSFFHFFMESYILLHAVFVTRIRHYAIEIFCMTSLSFAEFLLFASCLDIVVNHFVIS